MNPNTLSDSDLLRRIAQLAQGTRDAQIAYFAARKLDQDASTELQVSKQLERALDDHLVVWEARERGDAVQQESLF